MNALRLELALYILRLKTKQFNERALDHNSKMAAETGVQLQNMASTFSIPKTWVLKFPSRCSVYFETFSVGRV